MIEFLVGLARYPLIYETSFSEFDTIPRAAPFHPANAEYAAFLLAPLEPEDAGTLGVIWEATPEPIHVHRVVAITRPEYEFALKFPNGMALWVRLVDLRRPLLVDEARPDAARGRL